ncbi:MAG: hypothetical protein NMK33_05230 [Candidatus Cardinium sp.]|uniref:hypothetical protein n=1 Tax=Cardinium endosymbiont of Dermatophagoides farinae TaxID=2597823 RepID=UPI0011830711|nr:hypothetical protein [Cardinium endosymbiont of Dermatophagoides farinae]TSJ80818.1 hypothetical protein FPG78_02025 [Cardinium endosymbiont of Dermatophagoides farinae]UWW96821.1 MAG: hypothetical protein NMK33_05230 [Candidatus Cardinium sp.]
MKKYCIVLLFIISCNRLSKFTSTNMGQASSSQNVSEDKGEDKSKKLGTIKLDTVNLEVVSYEYLKAWYRSIAALSLDHEKAYRDIKSFLREGRLLFFDPAGKATLTQEVLSQVIEIWDTGRTLFSYCRDTHNIFNIENFIKIPDRIKLPMALDDLKESPPDSFKENNPILIRPMDCFKMLFIKHAADNETIKERFYELYSNAYKGTFASLFGLVVCLKNYPLLEEFLNAMSSKNINIAINDKQIYCTVVPLKKLDKRLLKARLYHRHRNTSIQYNEINTYISNNQNLGTVRRSFFLDPASLHNYYPIVRRYDELDQGSNYSVFEYMLEFAEEDGLKLLMSYHKELNKDPLVSIEPDLIVKVWHHHPEKLKLLIEGGVFADQVTIMDLIWFKHVAIVLDCLNQGFIKKETLIRNSILERNK